MKNLFRQYRAAAVLTVLLHVVVFGVAGGWLSRPVPGAGAIVIVGPDPIITSPPLPDERDHDPDSEIALIDFDDVFAPDGKPAQRYRPPCLCCSRCVFCPPLNLTVIYTCRFPRNHDSAQKLPPLEQRMHVAFRASAPDYDEKALTACAPRRRAERADTMSDAFMRRTTRIAWLGSRR